jgi:hypothetical protein
MSIVAARREHLPIAAPLHRLDQGGRVHLPHRQQLPLDSPWCELLIAHRAANMKLWFRAGENHRSCRGDRVAYSQAV